MGCCVSAHRDQDSGSTHRDEDSDQDQAGPGGGYKSPARVREEVREARFRSRDCGSPLATVCNDAVQHVLEGREVQDAHREFARGNARHIAGAFEILPDPEEDPADPYVAVVRMTQRDLFDPHYSFKIKMDCLLKNYLGVRRGTVYSSGEGPSLQLQRREGTGRRRRSTVSAADVLSDEVLQQLRMCLPGRELLRFSATARPLHRLVSGSVAGGALRPAQVKTLPLLWLIEVLHGFVHYRAEIVPRRVKSSPCLLTSCICGQQPARPAA